MSGSSSGFSHLPWLLKLVVIAVLFALALCFYAFDERSSIRIRGISAPEILAIILATIAIIATIKTIF